MVDLVAADFPRRQLFPAGRLDKTSTGFVLLTDDGTLAHDILSPAHHVREAVRSHAGHAADRRDAGGFAAGVTLTNGETLAPACVKPARADP